MLAVNSDGSVTKEIVGTAVDNKGVSYQTKTVHEVQARQVTRHLLDTAFDSQLTAPLKTQLQAKIPNFDNELAALKAKAGK